MYRSEVKINQQDSSWGQDYYHEVRNQSCDEDAIKYYRTVRQKNSKKKINDWRLVQVNGEGDPIRVIALNEA